MSHRIAHLSHVLTLTALAVAGPLAGTGVAAIQVFDRAGTQPFVVPAGITSLTVEAVGGRGGNLGGYGARVRGTIAVTPGESLEIQVAGSGSAGLAGFGGGGAVPFGSFAAGGGGASFVARGGTSLVVAGGGGGHGGDSDPGQGGDGGDAGTSGEGGTSLDVYMVRNSGGGGAGESSAPGAPGTAGEALATAGCAASSPGSPGAPDAAAGQGGSGGQSADPFGFGDGGGGGGGLYGGGGGGSGGYCATRDEGHGGGGGGGGSSLAPIGGSFVVDSTGVPGVTLVWENPRRSPTVQPRPRQPRIRGPFLPTVTITVPADGAVYERGALLTVDFSCERGTARSAVIGCKGTRTDGRQLDTTRTGTRSFKVAARTSLGERTEKTITYRVEDTVPPTIRGLRLAPRTLSLGEPGAWAGVRFRLHERARVRVRLARVGDAAGARVRTLAGHVGRNGFRLRASAGRRTLRPGSYRLTLVATDAAGNRSRPVSRRFSVVG